MSVEKALQHVDMNEPILVKWLLERIENLKRVDEEKAAAIEKRFFTEENIRNLLATSDRSMIQKMFFTVSPEMFSGIIPEIVEKWPAWQGEMAAAAAIVIAKADQGAAVKLFNEYCRQGPEQFYDSSKWLGVYFALSDLPHDRAAGVARVMVDAFLSIWDNESASGSGFYWDKIIGLAWKADHPDVESILKKCILNFRASRRRHMDDLVKTILVMFGFSVTDYILICDFMDDPEAARPSALSPVYDYEALPAEAIETALKRMKTDGDETLVEFFDANMNVIDNEKIRNAVKNIIRDREVIEALGADMTFIRLMALTVLFAALRRPEPRLEGMDVDQIVALISENVSALPNEKDIHAFLKQQDEETVSRALIDALEAHKTHYGGVHVVGAMGALGYDAFLPVFMGLVESENESDMNLAAIAQRYLPGYGDRMADIAAERFDNIGNAGRLRLLNVMRVSGGEKAAAFVAARFDVFWKMDKEGLMEACRALCIETCRERIRPKINKDQKAIDEAYATLSLLTGRRSDEVDALLKVCEEREKEQAAVLDAFSKGDILSIVKPYVVAEMECKACGDKSDYRLRRIIFTRSNSPYVAQEIACLNCEKLADFDLTEKGQSAIQAEILRLSMLESEEDKKAARERTPLEFIRFKAFGKEMDLNEAIARYKEKIEENPNNVKYHLGLGNIYGNANQPTRARPYFERAMELDPEYLQAQYGLAQIAEESGDYAGALKILGQGLPHLNRFKHYQMPAEEIVTFQAAYCAFYNEMIKRSGSELPRIRIPDVSKPVKREGKKVGRNEPCPCGSGKKYKKCCLNKK